jgi:hypothetical protein
MIRLLLDKKNYHDRQKKSLTFKTSNIIFYLLLMNNDLK